MAKRGNHIPPERLDIAAAFNDRVVSPYEMEAALDALLGKDNAANEDELPNRVALQRAFLLLALHYRQVVSFGFEEVDDLTDRLTELLDLYKEGELHLPFDPVTLRRDKALFSARPKVDELRSIRPEERYAALLEMPQLWTVGGVELLCAESLNAAAKGDAAEAISWAELGVRAVTGTEHLSKMIADATARIIRSLRAGQNGGEQNKEAGERELEDLRAYALAHLANAHRVAGDLHRAEQLFTSMKPSLTWGKPPWWSTEAEWGTELPYNAVCYALVASLRRAQRRVPEALDLLARARQREGDLSPLWRARFMLAEAKALEEIGRLQDAIRRLEQHTDIARIDPSLERLWIGNLAGCWALAKEPDKAELALSPLGKPVSAHEEVYFEWVRGLCHAARDQHQEAVECLRTVRSAFLERSNGAYDAALVSLELSLSLAKLGNFEEVAAVARDSMRFFAAQGIDREAIASLVVFQQAATAGTHGIIAMEAVYRYLRRAKGDKSVKFEPAP